MRSLSFFLLLLLMNNTLMAQSVGIGTNSPNSSAILEISSSTKGLLLPRLADTSSIANPVKGLLIYSNSNNKTWYYDGSKWQHSAGNSNSGNNDSLWYEVRDSVAYTAKKYVAVNTNYNLIGPQSNLQVTGSLLIQGDYDVYSKTNPTPAQTYTMLNSANSTNIPGADSVFQLYDPSGPNNSYGGNMQGSFSISIPQDGKGVKVSSIAADFGLGTGDTLWISSTTFPACRDDYEFRFANTTKNPGDFIIPSRSRYIIFRSNGDASIGKGFSFKCTRIYGELYKESSPGKVHPIGQALYYSPGDGSFSVGNNADAAKIGTIAMGESTRATGDYSIAIGGITSATNNAAVALGYGSAAAGEQSFALAFGYAKGDASVALGGTANGAYSTAMRGGTATGYFSLAQGIYALAPGTSAIALGENTRAEGGSAVALGNNTNASGLIATAIGSSTTAGGDYSTALGKNTIAYGYASTALGLYNDPIMLGPQTTISQGSVIFTLGNGSATNARSNAIVVLKSGNTGIGTNFPGEKLDVAGNINMNNASGTTLQLQAAGADKGFVQLSGDNLRIGVNSSNSTGNVIFRLNGGDRFTIFPNGNATLTGTLTQNSDERLKENIQPIDHALDKLLRLNGYQYNWKRELKRDEQLQIGLIAQNVEKVFPELVATNVEGMKSVAYQNMVPVLIEAIKEQQKQMAIMQKKIEMLEQSK